MNIENCKVLAEILKNYQLSRIEIIEGETKILLEREGIGKQNSPNMPFDTNMLDVEKENLAKNSFVEIKSPIVGIFYSAPSPDSPNFVSVGSKIKRGDVLCIIEAMKHMNELTTERDGEIIDICVKNEEIIEFGQVLFKIT